MDIRPILPNVFFLVFATPQWYFSKGILTKKIIEMKLKNIFYILLSIAILHITNEPSGNDSFTLSYRVTDGMRFSEAVRE